MAPTKTYQLYLLPVVAFILVPVGFLLNCALAVASKSISPLFPTISDSGAEGPGRLFFGPLTTLSAIVITILGIYVNLTHETLLKWRNHDNPWKLRLGRAVNNVALVSAVVSASGIFVAGGVPQTVSAVTHQVGALLAFSGGVSFTFCITTLSIMAPSFAWLTAVRITLCLIITAAFAGSWLTLNITNQMQEFGTTGTNSVWIGHFRLNADDDAILRLALTCINEWILCACFGCVLLTLIPEFLPMRVYVPTIAYGSHSQHGNHRPKAYR